MLYVEQSLGKGEEIVGIGEFHWMYTVQAVSWIVIGLLLACGIIHGGVHLDVMTSVNKTFTNLPANLMAQAEGEVMKQKGGYIAVAKSLHPAIRAAAFGMFIFGLFMFARLMVIKATTEICITNKRLIYKQGLIARHVGEMNVDRIEGVNVYQGIFGRLFGYGGVIVRGMGVGEVGLPQMREPIAFRKAIERSKTL